MAHISQPKTYNITLTYTNSAVKSTTYMVEATNAIDAIQLTREYLPDISCNNVETIIVAPAE